MSELSRLLAEPETTVAVIGASDNPSKYGSIIYRDLKARGFRLYPVNPHRATVDGDPAYPNLSALPQEPGIIDMVVPPEIGRTVLEEANRLGYRRIWFQPGSESQELLAYSRQHGFQVVEACIMVAAAQAGRRRTGSLGR